MLQDTTVTTIQHALSLTEQWESASKHSDPDFFTILLQDQIGGLQVLYQNQWADIPPVIGALLILETFFRQVQLHIIEETIY